MAADWDSEHDARALAFLAEWPHLERLREQVGRADVVSRLFAPREAGGRWFRLVVHEPYASPCLHVSDRPDEPGRLLLDPGRETLDWFVPSPDGRLVAVGLAERGSEQSVLRLVDAETGELRPDRLPHASFAVVAWLPDSSGFYLNRSLGHDLDHPQKHLFFHRVGEEPRAEPEPAVFRDDEDYVWPQVSADGRYVAAVSSDAEPRPDSILDREAGDGVWRPFLLDLPAIVNGFFAGDTYLAIVTDDEHPRGRVLSIPLDGAEWTELVPEGDGVMRGLGRDGDLLVLHELIETRSRVRLLTASGEPAGEVPLPPDTVAGGGAGLTQHALEGALGLEAFVLGSFESGPALVRYRDGLETLIPGEPRPYEVDASYRRTPDGVTYWLVRRRDATGPLPTIVHGYGGWNVAFGLPGGTGIYEPFVAAGGSLALPHLPGGGEHGFDQWLGGFRDRKQATFDALYAVAEDLRASGASSRLGAVGASNGGLLTAVALTQRPELWAAVVSLVPVADMLHYADDGYPAEFALEYGHPDDSPWLAAYSPPHNVRAGVAYPPTLVVCGDTDVRCPAWHGRVLTTRLEEVGAPVWYRLRRDAGHLVASHRDAHEWLGFLMRHLGVDPC